MGLAGRTILIDANVIEQIGRGNRQAADTMRSMRANGATIYVTQQSYNEMVNNPAIPRTRAAKRELLRDMNIRIAPPGNAGERQEAIGANTVRYCWLRACFWYRAEAVGS